MNKGFSLVELIVVIAIMAILVGVAVPVYTSYISSANEKVDAQYVDELQRAADTLVIDIEADLTEEWKDVVIPAKLVWSAEGVKAYDAEGAEITATSGVDFVEALATLIDVNVDPKQANYSKEIVIG